MNVSDNMGRLIGFILLLEGKEDWGEGGGSDPLVQQLVYYARPRGV